MSDRPESDPDTEAEGPRLVLDPAPVREAEAITAAEVAPEPRGSDGPQVGIVMGSKSDLPAMEAAERELSSRGISSETNVMSAHREPDKVSDYARAAKGRGIRVIIAGAGLSAALPGVVAAHTELPRGRGISVIIAGAGAGLPPRPRFRAWSPVGCPQAELGPVIGVPLTVGGGWGSWYSGAFR